mgnify:CR=1 FL=1
MPKNMSLFNSLKKQYGDRAEEIYARMESEAKPAFKQGIRTVKARPKGKGGK